MATTGKDSTQSHIGGCNAADITAPIHLHGDRTKKQQNETGEKSEVFGGSGRGRLLNLLERSPKLSKTLTRLILFNLIV